MSWLSAKLTVEDGDEEEMTRRGVKSRAKSSAHRISDRGGCRIVRRLKRTGKGTDVDRGGAVITVLR